MAYVNDTTVMLSAPPIYNVEAKKHNAYLIPQAGNSEPLALDAPQSTIGRGIGVDYVIGDPRVSRHHAKVLALHNRYYVQDLRSANGTFLNGTRIENERLAHGDLVDFGGHVFRFVISSDLDANYLKKFNLEAVTALAEAVDKKDPYTGNHSRCVSETAEQLARALDLGPAAEERIRIAGRLHDIGKIGVPDAILRKPGRLEASEFAVVRQHPADGEAILAPLQFLADVLPAVRQHHERFDGRGYPDGLGSTDISLDARIIQVADSLNAMTSSRTYRPAQSLDFVRREFISNSGTQFDPRVVEAMLDILPSLQVA
jgi:HD-GYP domain-containing protein (c-di-GMP phosphodiesterase class II)